MDMNQRSITLVDPNDPRMNRRWHEKNEAIYSSLPSNGMTGPGWVEHFRKKGTRLCPYAISMLLSREFRPTKGITTYQFAILRATYFEENDRVTWNIRAEASERNFLTPNAELACLIRDCYTDDDIEAMGLSRIDVMHEPIKDSSGDLSVLGVLCGGNGPWLDRGSCFPSDVWPVGSGFAFEVSRMIVA